MQFKNKVQSGLKTVTLQKSIVYIAFVVAFLVFTVFLGDRGFFTVTNLVNIVKQTSMITIMAFGMVFVIGAGQIDLTVGANVALSGLIAAIVMRDLGSPVLAIICALFVGALIGVVNGNILVYTGLPPFLITIGTQIIIKGIAMWVADNSAIPILNQNFNFVFGNGTVFGIPVLILWCLVFLILAYILLNMTSFGSKILGVGGNELAARYSGINVNRIKRQAMLISSLFASFAGLLYAARLEAGHYIYGDGVEMNIIAAVVLGGTNMNGGVASIIGTLFGAMLMGMIDNGLIIAGMSVSQQMIVRGIVVICATALGNIGLQKKNQ